ncbi:MAG: aldo/keto reductase [Saprospiraceae bacterium]|nr:aldo/keto reductase [Saprospiraceae bacterium]
MDSRASSHRGNGAIDEGHVAEDKINKARQLNVIAEARGQNLAQMALSWILKDNRITSVLIGVSKSEQILDSLRCLENYSFTPEELNSIEGILNTPKI